MKKIASLLICSFIVFTLGCKQEGPAQQAGEKIDGAIESIQEKIDPPGPAEKAGKEVDKVLSQ